jgi:hypothetical protein
MQLDKLNLREIKEFAEDSKISIPFKLKDKQEIIAHVAQYLGVNRQAEQEAG